MGRKLLMRQKSYHWTSQVPNDQMKDKKRTTADEDSNQRMVQKHFGTMCDIWHSRNKPMPSRRLHHCLRILAFSLRRILAVACGPVLSCCWKWSDGTNACGNCCRALSQQASVHKSEVSRCCPDGEVNSWLMPRWREALDLRSPFGRRGLCR
jgi:hypothetical protein